MTSNQSTPVTETPSEEECTSTVISRLELVPHDVQYTISAEDSLEPTGQNELLDATWEETDEWMCPECNTEFDDETEALNHVKSNQDQQE